jgi:DsbC/DsbD-like thiol-disulfide interchange protein/cytochrome c biogenesis protein CcdA
MPAAMPHERTLGNRLATKRDSSRLELAGASRHSALDVTLPTSLVLPLRFCWLALLCLVAVLASAPVRAAPTNIQAVLLAEGPGSPGETITLAITMRPDEGWHGYWSNPGDAGLGMTLDWNLPSGAEAGSPRYPVPETLTIGGLMNHVYEHAYAVLVPFTVPANARPGAVLPVSVAASWLACTDKVCVPERGTLRTTVRVARPGAVGAPDPRFDAWRARLPAPLGARARFAVVGDTIRLGIPLPADLPLAEPHFFAAQDHVVDYAAPQTFRREGDLLTVELSRPGRAAVNPDELSGVLRLNAAGDGVEIAAEPGAVPSGGEIVAGPPVAAPAALPLLLLGALLGGLLLNIMPCVFPILSLKALSLARAGESQADARREGFAYTAGVIVACLALGALLLALRAAGSEVGWAFQLQEPAVVAGLTLLAAAITANLAGLFELAVPSFEGPGSTNGAFATGLLAAFVATPCTGPFMAAAMGAALLLPTAWALALFATLGLGLALPFLAVALLPALRRRLPRPGPWMIRFRHAMAIPMGLTALALLWLASRLGGTMFALLLAGAAAVTVAILLIVGTIQRRGRRAILPALGALLAAAAAVALLPQTLSAPSAAGEGVIPARPFSEAALASARAEGRPVFAWFTADWCLTCKVNEQVAIEREATRAAFERAGVVALLGDWTRRDPAITRYLTRYGAAGVPLYVWYPPGGEGQVLPQVLTPATLPDLAAGLPAKE